MKSELKITGCNALQLAHINILIPAHILLAKELARASNEHERLRALNKNKPHFHTESF